MKGLSPLRIMNLTNELRTSAGAKFHRGTSSVDKIETEKEGIPNPIDQGPLTSTMALSSPEEDKDKGAGLEILNLKVEEEDLSYGGTEIAVLAVDQAKSDGEGSVDLSSTCEDEETSDEEVEPLVGEEIQEGTEASVCPGNADTGLVYPEAKKEEEDVVEVDSSGSIEVPFPGEFLSNTKTEDSRGKLRFPDCLATAGSWLYGLVVFSRYLTGIKTLGPLNFWYAAGDRNLEL
ncbi:hypothetical protein U1Q18_042449 [Sarracenia purpurea var. burkii]